jgi:hypothetical protein
MLDVVMLQRPAFPVLEPLLADLVFELWTLAGADG